VKTVQNVEIPYCLLCQKVFSSGSFKHSNLQRHQRTQHGKTVGKPVEYYNRLIPVSKEKMAEDKAADEVQPKAFEASFKISSKIAKAGNNHTIGKTFVYQTADPSNCVDHA
jgi:hypothetical protein